MIESLKHKFYLEVSKTGGKKAPYSLPDRRVQKLVNHLPSRQKNPLE